VAWLFQDGIASLGFPEFDVWQCFLVERLHDSQFSFLKGADLANLGFLEFLGETIEVVHDDLVVCLQTAVLQLHLGVLLLVVLQLLVALL
jgi:hypothetical protein